MRMYYADQTIAFCKTKELYGEFSNMCSGFDLKIGEHLFNSSEALYQALKFPDHPDVQKEILESKNAMGSKFVARKYTHLEDPTFIGKKKIEAMRLVLHLKHMQHFEVLKPIFKSSNGFNIVEFSDKDLFWGCNYDKLSKVYQGKNALGRLLMELRVISISAKDIHFVNIPKEGFKLFWENFEGKINKDGTIEL